MMAALLVIIGVIVLVLGLNYLFPNTLEDRGNQMGVVYAIALVTVLSSTIAFTFRQRWSKTIKHALIWVLLLVVLVLLYSYRHDFRFLAMRVAGELVPGMTVERAPGEIFLRASEDGHYRVRSDVNGASVVLMVDTGASLVVLSHRDAVRAGFDPEDLSFSQPVSTANGQTYVASVLIGEIAIGPIAYSNVRGAIARRGDLDDSLLGMTFLGRLEGFEFGQDGLTLRQ